MLTKYPNLNVAMFKAGINQKALAELLNMSPTTLSFKINGKTDFTITEIEKIKDIFNLPYEDIFLPYKSTA